MDLCRNLSRWQPGFAMTHQQADDVEPGFIGKGRKGREGWTLLHVSTIHEMLKYI